MSRPPHQTSPLPGRSPAIADGSTFAPALRLLEEPLRSDVATLYSVLRSLDDLVDEEDPNARQRVAAVELWAQGRLPSAAQAPEALETRDAIETPETRALRRLASRHPIPRASILQFCAGMRHDIAHASVRDDRELMRYCQQAGGSVGEVLASILGSAKDDEEGRSAARAGIATLGRAMQVTNILRDIDEDLEHGRIYLPQSAMKRFGLRRSGEWQAREGGRETSPGGWEALLSHYIALADDLYEEGERAIELLAHGRDAMSLAAALYREILRQIERDGFGVKVDAKAGRTMTSSERTRELRGRGAGSAEAAKEERRG